MIFHRLAQYQVSNRRLRILRKALAQLRSASGLSPSNRYCMMFDTHTVAMECDESLGGMIGSRNTNCASGTSYGLVVILEHRRLCLASSWRRMLMDV